MINGVVDAIVQGKLEQIFGSSVFNKESTGNIVDDLNPKPIYTQFDSSYIQILEDAKIYETALEEIKKLEREKPYEIKVNIDPKTINIKEYLEQLEKYKRTEVGRLIPNINASAEVVPQTIPEVLKHSLEIILKLTKNPKFTTKPGYIIGNFSDLIGKDPNTFPENFKDFKCEYPENKDLNAMEQNELIDSTIAFTDYTDHYYSNNKHHDSPGAPVSSWYSSKLDQYTMNVDTDVHLRITSEEPYNKFFEPIFQQKFKFYEGRMYKYYPDYDPVIEDFIRDRIFLKKEFEKTIETLNNQKAVLWKGAHQLAETKKNIKTKINDIVSKSVLSGYKVSDILRMPADMRAVFAELTQRNTEKTRKIQHEINDLESEITQIMPVAKALYDTLNRDQPDDATKSMLAELNSLVDRKRECSSTIDSLKAQLDNKPTVTIEDLGLLRRQIIELTDLLDEYEKIDVDECIRNEKLIKFYKSVQVKKGKPVKDH